MMIINYLILFSLFSFFLGSVMAVAVKSLFETEAFSLSFRDFPWEKFLLLIYLWSLRELRTKAAEMLSLTKNTVGNVYRLLRCYCTRDLQDRPVIPFAGNVYVVKCDESQFKHKPKVSCAVYAL